MKSRRPRIQIRNQVSAIALGGHFELCQHAEVGLGEGTEREGATGFELRHCRVITRLQSPRVIRIPAGPNLDGYASYASRANAHYMYIQFQDDVTPVCVHDHLLL
jgi:hypothetical protein